MSEYEIVFSAKGQVDISPYEDVPLRAGEIRGRTEVTLVSQGTELAWLSGENFPIRPGYASVFEVTEMAPDVTGISIGDLRFSMGAHRSTQQIAAQSTLPIPKDLPGSVAVFARLMGVTMTTLKTTNARLGDKVIVCGAGPVGFLAAQQCRIAGFDIAVVEPSELRRKQIFSAGITTVFEKMPLDNHDWLGKTALVMDCSGHEQAVLDGCRLVRHGGEVVLIGVPWRAYTDFSAHDLLNAVFFNFVNLRSGWEWELPLHSRSFVWEELYEGYNNAQHTVFDGFLLALKWLAAGQISLEQVVHTGNPRDIVRIYDDLRHQQIQEPFVVLKWRDETKRY